MCPVIRISDDLYNRLGSLAVGFDTPTNVIEKLLSEKGLNKISEKNLKDDIPSAQPDLPAGEFRKMNKIEGWANKNLRPDVGRVIQTYLDLTKDNIGIDSGVFIEELEKRKIYGGEYSKIKNNLSQMKNDDGHSHGRVFYNQGNKLVIYDVAYAEIQKFSWF